MRKILDYVVIAVLMFCFIWLLTSWVDVINNNIGNGSHFANWNLFKICFGKFL